MYKRLPWTMEQLDKLLPKLEDELDEIEGEEEGEVNPVGPLTQEEAEDYIYRIMTIATQRVITSSEKFLCGQLISTLKMAVQAETLGYKEKGERYFVASEKDINNLMKGV